MRSLASPALTSDGVRMRTIGFYDMKIASGATSLTIGPDLEGN